MRGIAHPREIAVTLRLVGIVLLALCAFVLRRIHLLVQLAPRQPPTGAELALGLVAVLAGVTGAACLIVGPSVLRTYAWPPPDGD